MTFDTHRRAATLREAAGRTRRGHDLDQPLAPTARQVVELWLAEHDTLGEVLAGEKPGAAEMQGTSGPLRPSLEVRATGLTVRVPTQASWDQQRRYHHWCREHGYPTGELYGVDRRDQPPAPGRDGEPVGVTWHQVHEWAQALVYGEQLGLAI